MKLLGLLMAVVDYWTKIMSEYASWKDARRRLRAMKLFYDLFKDPKSGMAEIVGSKAQHVALAMVMTWMDSKRILHCRFCPVTGPLTKYKDYFVCEKHLLVPEKSATSSEHKPVQAAAPTLVKD